MRTARVFRTVIAVPLITYITYRLLRHTYPVYWDGGGPMPSFFYFGHAPTMAEYHAHQLRYDSLMVLPYVVVSLLLVWLSVYLAPKLSSRINRSRITLGGTAFALIVTTVLVNDCVARAFNRGGIFLAPHPDSLLSFMVVAVPVVLLSAMIAKRELQD